MGSGAAIPHSRPGSDLRRHRHRRLRAMGIRDKLSFTLAEWLCRTADRVDPTRVCGPHYCLWRGTPAPDSAIVCLLLQRYQNSPVIGQGCADLSPGSADRCHQFHAPSLADSITTTPEFRFSVQTGVAHRHDTLCESQNLANNEPTNFARG